ncbi:MAG: hypothetical protein Q4C95_02850 [Planctomycetia bacterium]|nr:hypothetical protein [Planctomycetia bacterium]
MKFGPFSVQNLNEILSSPKIKPFVERLQPTAVVATVKGVFDDLSKEFKSAAAEHRIPDFTELTEKIVERLQKIEKTNPRLEINATGIFFRNEQEAENQTFSPNVIEKMIWNVGFQSSTVYEINSSSSSSSEKNNSSTIDQDDSIEESLADSPSSFETIGDSIDFHYFQYQSTTLNSEIEQATSLLGRLTGAKDAIFFANPYLAKWAALQTFCHHKQLVIARRDLYEIENGWRQEDLLNRWNIRFKEVGAINKTTVDDYAQACSHKTGLFYFAVGQHSQLLPLFAQSELLKLKEKTKEFQIPLFCELEFASIADLNQFFIDGVPILTDYINKGYDLILCRTSQLIGGPNCGVLLGEKCFLDKVRSLHFPQFCAPHSTDMAGLNQLFSFYLDEKVFQNIPILQKIAVSADNLKNRASRIVPQLKASSLIKDIQILPGNSFLFPQAIRGRMPTFLISIEPSKTTPELFAKSLEKSYPSLNVRWNQTHIMIDLKTVPPQFDSTIVDLLSQ